MESINKPFVSVIIATRNEMDFIDACIISILDNDYPEDRMEVIVIDGDSDDDTAFNASLYRRVTLEFNSEKITPVAWNIGIRRAKGDLIMILGAHATYPKDYIPRHVEWFRKDVHRKVHNVGGIIDFQPRAEGLLPRCCQIVKSDKFGVGKSEFRIGTNEPQYVDTVFGGCYRREVFEMIGMFNENLVHSQDLEFNLRLKKAGLKTLLDPSIVSQYYARSNLRGFLKKAFQDGQWAILPMKWVKWPIRPRHIIPLIFFLTLPVALVPYIPLNIFRSIQISVRYGDPRLAFALPFVFLLYHLVYGVGSLKGLIEVCRKRFLS